jgi:hypothetical protein
MAEDAYAAWLQEQLGGAIDELALGPNHKRYLHSRWLDQIVWLEKSAKRNQRRYYALRLVAIVGGVIVPALVSLNVRKDEVASAIAWTTFALSLVVAAAVAVEGFFRYGERWRHYRRTVELLKSHGWQFFELAGDYAGHRTHDGPAFRAFAAAVETLIGADVEAYLAQVTKERAQGSGDGGGGAPAAAES